MRYLSLIAVVAALAFVAPASANHSARAQDLAHLRAGGLTGRTSQYKAPPDDRTPWDAMAAGIAVITIAGAVVGIVRTRRRVSIAA